MGYIPGLTEFVRDFKRGNDWNVGVRDLRSSYIIPEGHPDNFQRYPSAGC